MRYHDNTNHQVIVAPRSYLDDADLNSFCGALLQVGCLHTHAHIRMHAHAAYPCTRAHARQYPNTYGTVSDLSDLSAKLKKAKCGFVVATDPLALTVLKSPGEVSAQG